jgi:hypothetical protein
MKAIKVNMTHDPRQSNKPKKLPLGFVNQFGHNFITNHRRNRDYFDKKTRPKPLNFLDKYEKFVENQTF